MSLLVYPVLPGLSFNVKWTPAFFNQSQKTITGASIDIGLAQYPLHNFELTYEVLRDTPGVYTSPQNEFKILIAFYASMNGSLGRFWFDNPDDRSVLGQQIGIGDGVNTTFLLIGPIGAWPIGALNGSPTFYRNGVVVPGGDASLFDARGAIYIIFVTPPGAGVIVTVDMNYYYVCHFTDDSSTFEKFITGRWLNSSVKFQSVRPGA